LPLVLEQANSKNKMLRAAALEALAEHDRPEVTKLFTDLVKGKSLDILAGPFRAIRNRQVLNSLLDEGKRVFDLILKGDEEQIPRFSEILDCLQHRQDAESEEFLLDCFNQCNKLAKLKAAKNSHVAGADLMVRLSSLLYDIGSPKTLEALLAKRDVLPPTAFGQVLRSALRTWSADKIYQEFAPLLEQKKGAGKEKSEELQHAIWASCSGSVSDLYYLQGIDPDTSEAQMLKNLEWDPRWLDAAIKANQQVIVCWLARPDHKGAVTYLLKLLEAENQSLTGLIIHALARCQYPKLTNVFLDLVARKTKNPRHYQFVQPLLESARFLPADDLPQLDAFAATLDEKFIDEFLEALAPLRSVNPTN